MFEAKKLQLEVDKKALNEAKEQFMKYVDAARNAKNKGMKSINEAKAKELGLLIDIIERRCKVLTK